MTSHKFKHILKLSSEEKRKFLDSFDYVFSDIDGVAWNLYSDIKGASDGFKFLKNSGKNLTFITNNSVRLMEAYESKFKKLDLDVDLDHLWHPAKSIVKYLKSINFDGLIYIIACENFKKVFREAGFQLIDGPNEFIEESFSVMATHIFDRQPVRAVVMDVDFNLTSIKMIRAQQYLRNPECLFIVGATDMLLPVMENVGILGPGAFIKALSDGTNRTPITVGKPGVALAELLKKDFHVQEPKRALMIGDMLEQDIAFGRECGFQTLLVLSGGCKLSELLAEKNPKLLPDYYADSVGDFIEFAKDIKKSQV